MRCELLVKSVKYTMFLAVSCLVACAPKAHIPETGEVADVLVELEKLTPYGKVAAAHLAMTKLSKEGRGGERASALAQDLLARGEYDLVDALERIAEDDVRAFYWGALSTWGQWYPQCKQLLDRFIRRRGKLTTELAIRGGLHLATWEFLVKCALDTSEDGYTRIRAVYALASNAPDDIFGRISALKEDHTSFGAPGTKYGKSLIVAEEYLKYVEKRSEFGWGKQK